MKKFTIQCVLLLFFSSTFAFAQDTLKTSAGRWTTELNINPLQGQISLNNAINQIKVRYFVTNQTALRFAFSLNNIKRDENQKSIYGTNPLDDSYVYKTTTFGLNLGFEQHLTGTRRLSPYIGAEIAFGLKSSKETIDTKESTTEIKGGWETYQSGIYYDPYYRNNISYQYSIPSENGYTSFGINLITGFDFYISKHLFVGYELLFGYNYLKYDDFEVTVTPKPGQTVSNTNYPTKKSKESNFGAKIINGIRFGYTF